MGFLSEPVRVWHLIIVLAVIALLIEEAERRIRRWFDGIHTELRRERETR